MKKKTKRKDKRKDGRRMEGRTFYVEIKENNENRTV